MTEPSERDRAIGEGLLARAAAGMSDDEFIAYVAGALADERRHASNIVAHWCAAILNSNADALDRSGFGPNSLLGMTARNLREQAAAMTVERDNASVSSV